MTAKYPDREEQALGWLVRFDDPEFADWHSFTLWLEEDPANAEAYQQLAIAEQDMVPLARKALSRRDVVPARVAEQRQRRSPRFAWLAAAAMIIALLPVVALQYAGTAYSTGPGQHRTIALGGSDHLILNGDTSVRLSGLNRRHVRLESGQVLLVLKDKGKGPVTLESGDLQLVDVGTVFDVTRDEIATRVEVREGAVLVDPSGARLRLPAGSRLDTVDGARRLKPRQVDAASIGIWSSGQLDYDDEPLPRVLGDIRRATGLKLRPGISVHGKRFTGSLSIASVKHDPQTLEGLLGVSMTAGNGGWTIQAR